MTSEHGVVTLQQVEGTMFLNQTKSAICKVRGDQEPHLSASPFLGFFLCSGTLTDLHFLW